MPESQFGQSSGSLDATLAELVALARHLRTVPADVSSRLSRLEGLTQMLRYFSTPPMLVAEGQPPVATTTHCAFDGCTRTWRDEDACLLNFAPRDTPALWFCRDHHPPLAEGGIRPSGWTPPIAELERLEAARKAALAALNRDQLRLVNGRV